MIRSERFKVLNIVVSAIMGLIAARAFGVLAVVSYLYLSGQWHSRDGQAGIGAGLIAMALSPLVGIAVGIGTYRLLKTFQSRGEH